MMPDKRGTGDNPMENTRVIRRSLATVAVTLSFLLFDALAAGTAARAADPPATASSTYHEIARYPVGGDGFWDYVVCDSAGKRLFVTRGTHVMVVGTEGAQAGKVIGDIPNTKGCHGVALAPELKRGFVSDGGDNTVTIFDTDTLNTIEKVAVGTRPDAILYDPATRRVFTFNAGSQDTTAIDAASGKVVGTIALGGKPEFAQSDGAGKVFVNIEDKSELLTLDPQGLTVLHRTALAPAEEPSGLALDAKDHRLFSARQQARGHRGRRGGQADRDTGYR